MTRFAIALVTTFALIGAARARDLPAGTWAANVDGKKGDFVVTQVKDGKVTGSVLGTDFTGEWNGKALVFEVGNTTYEAHLVSEPGEKGKVKYTLTGTQSRTNGRDNRVVIHLAKTGWYAQLTADAPAPTGFIRAEVRGTLVSGKSGAYVLVKRLVGTATEETRVQLAPDDWSAVKANLAALDGKEVIVTGALAEIPRARDTPFGGLSIVGKFEIKPATDPK